MTEVVSSLNSRYLIYDKNAKILPGQWSSDLNLPDFDDQQYQNHHVKYHHLAIVNKQQTHYGPIFLLKSDSLI